MKITTIEKLGDFSRQDSIEMEEHGRDWDIICNMVTGMFSSLESARLVLKEKRDVEDALKHSKNSPRSNKKK